MDETGAMTDFSSSFRHSAGLVAACLSLMLAGAEQSLANEPPAASYADCVRGAWPTIDDAEKRAAACSRALQSKALLPDEVALARLTRGAARYALGEKLVAGDDYREALQHYDAIVDPRNPDALNLYRRGASYGGLGQTERAFADYSQAIRLDPRRTAAYLDRGVLIAATTRAYSRAIDDFNRVLELEPNNVTALIARGSAQSQLGSQGLAIADLDRAITLDPGASQAFYHRGTVRSRLGEMGLALQDYDQAIRLNPENVAALISRAGLLSSEGRYEAAILDLDRAIELQPENARAFYNRGYAYFSKGDYARAIQDYSFAITLDPNMANAYNNRCLARAVAGRDLVRALADCDAAHMLAPLSLDVRSTRGFVFLKLGDPELALHEYDTVLQLDPNRAAALYGKGLALIAIGKAVEGKREQAAALALDPEAADFFARYGLK